jgi:cell division transport system permease protein
MRAQVVTSEVTSGLRRNLLMTVALVITVMVSLLLVMMGLAVREQAKLTKKFWFNSIEVSVFLCSADSTSSGCAGGTVTQDQRNDIETTLQNLPQVKAVTYVSQQQAYQRAQIFFKGDAILQSITPGVLPETYEVKLKDPRQFDVVAGAIGGHAGVDNVEDEQEKLKPFFNVLRWMQIGALAVAIVMLGVATLLIVNTIQLSAYNRRRETGIKRLVGASNLSIQLPFVLEAVAATLLGGLLAAGSFALVEKVFFRDRLPSNVRISDWIGWSTALGIMGFTVALGVALAAVASFLSLQRYLRV